MMLGIRGHAKCGHVGGKKYYSGLAGIVNECIEHFDTPAFRKLMIENEQIEFKRPETDNRSLNCGGYVDRGNERHIEQQASQPHGNLCRVVCNEDAHVLFSGAC